MFADNSISSVFKYFDDKLNQLYSEREIQLFAEITLAVKFDVHKSQIILNERKFSESELLQFRAVVKRLKEKEPIQYILNNAHFYGLEFQVETGVLIPRPETEELVDLILKENPIGKVLDIGTGSGVIPVSLKSMAPALEVYALDVSDIALEIAEKNAKLNKVHVNFKLLDILHNDLGAEKYNIIVSNPPYVLESDKKEMTTSVLDYEPGLALFVTDSEPLKFYKRITTLAADHLVTGGKLYFEIHENFGNEVKDVLVQAGFNEVKIVQDLQGKDRIVRGTK